MFKLRIFRIYSAVIGFLYIFVSLLLNHISFGNRYFVAMKIYVYEIHSKMAYRVV
jgi:hypothetical protein